MTELRTVDDMNHTNDLGTLIEQSNDLDWLQQASCADLDVDELDLFFVEAGKSLAKETVAMCERCPARVACLSHAYDNEVAGGYFGGMSPSRRRKLTRSEALAEIAPTSHAG